MLHIRRNLSSVRQSVHVSCGKFSKAPTQAKIMPPKLAVSCRNLTRRVWLTDSSFMYCKKAGAWHNYFFQCKKTVTWICFLELWWKAALCLNFMNYSVEGRAIAQVVSCWLPNMAVWAQSHVTPCGICGWQRGTGTGSHWVLLFPCQLSFHWQLQSHHHLSRRDGTVGKIVANIPSGLSLITPPRNWGEKNYSVTHTRVRNVLHGRCDSTFLDLHGKHFHLSRF
jgi:hypothetical protein